MVIMKNWNDYLKTLIFVETSVKAGNHSVSDTYRRAAEKGVTNVKLDNGGATLKSLALAIFDFYWHSGTAAVKTVQRIVNTTVDGKLGQKTLASINVNDPRQLHLRVTFERLKFLETLARKPSQRGFLEGWKNRVAYMTYE